MVFQSTTSHMLHSILIFLKAIDRNPTYIFLVLFMEYNSIFRSSVPVKMLKIRSKKISFGKEKGKKNLNGK